MSVVPVGTDACDFAVDAGQKPSLWHGGDTIQTYIEMGSTGTSRHIIETVECPIE
jgi:hypothetical protein